MIVPSWWAEGNSWEGANVGANLKWGKAGRGVQRVRMLHARGKGSTLGKLVLATCLLVTSSASLSVAAAAACGAYPFCGT